MNELIEGLKRSLASEDARYAYADSVTNAFITGQIKSLREAKGLTQEELAGLVGTKQSGISRWQNTGYSSCKVDTLRKFAKAFGVRLRISFEEFGTLPADIRGFTKDKLCPRKFEDDPVFKEETEDEIAQKAARLASLQAQIQVLVAQLATNQLGTLSDTRIKIPEEVAKQFAHSDSIHMDLNPWNQLLYPNAARLLSILEEPYSASLAAAPQGANDSAANQFPEPTGMPPDPFRGLRLVVSKQSIGTIPSAPKSLFQEKTSLPQEKSA